MFIFSFQWVMPAGRDPTSRARAPTQLAQQSPLSRRQTRGGNISSDRRRSPQVTTTPIQEQINELFTDARRMHSQAVERLEQGDIRDAAEKA